MKLTITPVKTTVSAGASVPKKAQKTTTQKSAIPIKSKSFPSSPVLKPTVDDTYFVLIKNPSELRRQFLESSKKTIYGLQSYQRLVLIRHKKQLEIEKLRDLIKELRYLNKKIQDCIPDYKGTFINETLTPKRQQKKSATPSMTKSVPTVEKTELQKLEDSLAQIEQELKSLE